MCIDSGGSAESEAVAIDARAHFFESSQPIHPSQDLARADRIVNRLPREMATRYALGKPMVVALERIFTGCVFAGFLDSDSHMSGISPPGAINERLVWMGEEYVRRLSEPTKEPLKERIRRIAAGRITTMTVRPSRAHTGAGRLAPGPDRKLTSALFCLGAVPAPVT